MKTNFLHSHYFWFFVALSIVVGFIGWRSQDLAKNKQLDGRIFGKTDESILVLSPYLENNEGTIEQVAPQVLANAKKGEPICFINSKNSLKFVKPGNCHENKN